MRVHAIPSRKPAAWSPCGHFAQDTSSRKLDSSTNHLESSLTQRVAMCRGQKLGSSGLTISARVERNGTRRRYPSVSENSRRSRRSLCLTAKYLSDDLRLEWTCCAALVPIVSLAHGPRPIHADVESHRLRTSRRAIPPRSPGLRRPVPRSGCWQ